MAQHLRYNLSSVGANEIWFPKLAELAKIY